MVKRFFHPYSHPGYSARYSITENVARGHAYAVKHHIKQPYLHVGRELLALANVEERTAPKSSRHFRDAADYAFKLHRSRGR